MGRVRKGNEDSAAILPAGDGYSSGAIVCDGMGGGAAGEVASAIVVERVIAALTARPSGTVAGGTHAGGTHAGGTAAGGTPSGSLAERVRAGVAAANTAIREHARSRLDGAESGSTMVLALVSEGRATIAHLGDSRAYRLRAGRLEQLTADHTFVAEQVRAGLIPPERAASHPLRSRLTKAVGTAERATPEITEHELLAGDLLLLCSDGLHGMATDEEIAAALGPGDGPAGIGVNLDRMARALVTLANTSGGKDNVTVAMYRAS